MWNIALHIYGLPLPSNLERCSVAPWWCCPPKTWISSQTNAEKCVSSDKASNGHRLGWKVQENLQRKKIENLLSLKSTAKQAQTAANCFLSRDTKASLPHHLPVPPTFKCTSKSSEALILLEEKTEIEKNYIVLLTGINIEGRIDERRGTVRCISLSERVGVAKFYIPVWEFKEIENKID